MKNETALTSQYIICISSELSFEEFTVSRNPHWGTVSEKSQFNTWPYNQFIYDG